MTESSTGIRIGITLMIICSVIFVLLSAYSIASTYSKSFYDDKVTTITQTESELKDLYDVRVPVIQISDQLGKSVYGRNLYEILVEYPTRTNGKLDATFGKKHYYVSATSDFVKTIAAFEKDWKNSIGYVREVTENGSGTYTVCVRVGG